jgi:hypothetical protein
MFTRWPGASFVDGAGDFLTELGAVVAEVAFAGLVGAGALVTDSFERSHMFTFVSTYFCR